MGSLKNEMRGLTEEHQLCEKTDEGEKQVNSKPNSTAEGGSCQEDNQPELLLNSEEETVKNAISKEVLSDEDKSITDETADHEATQNSRTITNNLPSDGEAQSKSDAATDSISFPVPPTPDPFDPRSPAPFGQHHMRTQVSLEVVQCRSAATSPMTPPQGGSSFVFPSTFGKSDVGGDTKEAGLQVGQQVELCSVATSPMTPKTPFGTAFPALVGKEPVQVKEKEKNQQEESNNSQQVVSTATSPKEVESQETNAVTKESSGNPSSFLTAGSLDSQGTVESSKQQNKQQRMGSMDQDITILVTHHGNNEDDDEEKVESYVIEAETIKVDEYQEDLEDNNDEKSKGEETHDAADPEHKQKQAKEEGKPCMRAESLEVTDRKDACEETGDASAIKSPVPESPAPFGCHNIRTQVSLEVVQCQSVATSPMTPPDGDQAFCFPSSFGKCATVCTETKDAELQVGREVEFRSVATAPMTPRTPIATTFPEIKKGLSIDEKITEEVVEEKKELAPENEKAHKDEKEEDKEETMNSNNSSEEKCEEPVQEVSWDEKGMTWEVYGAVVEVAVLGSAIQKHLEKQVKKQKRQTSLPPPPPLNPSATPLTTESVQGGSGKGCGGKRREADRKGNRRRRNPFRQMMENMQQPHCCSRAHTTE
ncbi:G protein-regulated inducer of neurite outgrowth 1 [Oryzias melastigma]|uniref:G protein-regulated inducer of neurite outgrowth 1 n=1 Tax=Oryzias melastigma TaxID=30732 RepID=A0A3B3BVJ9_ORYME|nr:G protein-regulated inducer of neurite outgrowth 1 [Oryzias melastigma]XP_024139066.1 G protein-regulated inducer of neurite outgrowth 1 [Oryzias melastigma]KAF6731368.1 G protein-regulated inducer of neurite outgrowth 1 [Oryzias melastigma]